MGYQPGAFPADAIYGDPYKSSANLPTGEWNMIANGRIYQLDITKVSGPDVAADMHSGTIGNAKWSSAAGELTFDRTLPDGNVQHFTGYLLHQGSGETSWRIAGTFHQPNLAASAGWYATLPS